MNFEVHVRDCYREYTQHSSSSDCLVPFAYTLFRSFHAWHDYTDVCGHSFRAYCSMHFLDENSALESPVQLVLVMYLLSGPFPSTALGA